MNTLETFKAYIQNWNKIEGVKPCNEDDFIAGFIMLLNSIDDHRDIDFDGEGSYFGKQISLCYGQGVWIADKDLSFEISYSKKQIRVYTKNHNGFWRPEYMNIDETHPKFHQVKDILFNLLREVFGL